MKQKMKKTALVILAACLIMAAGIFPAPVITEAATTLDLNQWYDVSMQNYVPTDYTFIMPSKGYFYVQIQPVSYIHNGSGVSGGTCAGTYRITANNKLYEDHVEIYSDSDGTGMHNMWTSKNYAFKKGTRVTLSVIAGDDYDSYTASFRIRIVSNAPKNFETENNNSRATADPIKVQKTYSGYLMMNDTDWFVFKAPKTGTYKISASLPDSQSYEMNVTTYKGKKKLSENEILNLSGWKKQFKGMLKKGEKVYLKISRADYSLSHPEMHVKYQVKVQKS